MAHAKFSPSAAHRWLHCTASPALEAGLPDNAGDDANRGTLYHAVAEIMLRRLATPREAFRKASKREVSKVFKIAYAAVLEHGDLSKGLTPADAVRLMDEDQAFELVFPYVLYLRDELGNAVANPSGAYGFEAKLDMSFLGGECWGTADAWGFFRDTLEVVDLKTGHTPVDPEQNPQGVLYAIGALASLPAAFQRACTKVRITIHQGGYATTWETTPETLAGWEVSFSTVLRSAQQGGDLVAGPWCKWCRKQKTCGAYNDRNLELARSEFSVVEAGTDARQTLMTMPGQAAADFLNRFTEIEAFMAVAVEVLAERVYRDGLEVPGYKCVRGTKHKAWQDADQARVVLTKKFGDRAYRPAPLLTPTQAIKEFGEKEVAGLWTTPVGDLKLVTNASRGKPVTAAVEAEFSVVQDEAGNP